MYPTWFRSTLLSVLNFPQVKEGRPYFLWRTNSAEWLNYLVPTSVNSWQRGLNPPILWRSSSIYIVCSPLFEILSNLPFFVTSKPYPQCPNALSVIMFFWLNGWSRYIWCAILLNIKDLHMLSLSTLVLEGPWRVFYVSRHQFYWGLSYNAII